MSATTWKAPTSGHWRTPADWSGGVTPGPDDDVVLTSPDRVTITYEKGNAGAHSITATDDRLAVRGGVLTVGGTASLLAGLTISGGMLDMLGGGRIRDARISGSGQLDLGASTSLSGLTQSAGTIAIGAGSTLTLGGTDTLLGVGVIDGAGTLATTGTVTIATGAYFAVGATWLNRGVVNFAARSSLHYVGSDKVAGSLAFVNQAGGTINLNGDFVRVLSVPTLTNGGLLMKTAGTGESDIECQFVNAGTITIASGTLGLQADAALGGTIDGAGTLALDEGTYGGIFYSAAALSMALGTTLLLNDAAFNVNSSSSIGNLVTTGEYPGIDISAAGTLIVSNLSVGQGLPSRYSGPLVYGSGTLATTGTATLGTAYGAWLQFGEGLNWLNTGTVTLLSDITTGFSAADTAGITFINAAGAVFDLGSGAAILANYAASTFTNAGTIASVGGAITSQVINTGIITITGGVLGLDGGGTLDGTITGAGTLALGAGLFTGSALSKLVDTTLLMAGGTFVVTRDMAIPKLAIDYQFDSIVVSDGDTLTTANLLIDGDTTYNEYGLVMSGAGTLLTTGITVLQNTGTAPGLGIGVQSWLNSGTVELSDTIVAAGTWTNASGGAFDLSDGACESNIYGGTPALLSNAGLLQKAAGSGTTSIQSVLDNTGTITIASGTLALDGGGTLDGTINGAGTLALDGGSFAGSALSTLSSMALVLTGGTFDVTADSSVAQIMMVSSLPSPTTIVISPGDTLTTAILLETQDYYTECPIIEGPGTLTTTGTSLLNAIDYPPVENFFPTYLGGGLTWLNDGTASVYKYIFVEGSGTADIVHIVNSVGAVFDFAADNACVYDDTAGSVFRNAGLLEKSAGAGTSNLYSALTNTGTLTATNGTLALLGGAELDGQVGGTAGGQVLLAGDAFTTAGKVSVADSHANIAGLAVGGGQTWSVTGTVLDAGVVQLDGTGALAIGAGGVWAFSGPDGALTAPGTAGVSNAGTIQKTGGTLSSITAPIINTGLIDAGFGTLQLFGTITGTGTMRIAAASTLELSASLDQGQTLTFDGAGATLKLDAPASIAQPLQGLGAGDRIDLAGVTLTSASVAGSRLVLNDGATRFIFLSSGSLSGVSVQLTADGSGGTVATLSSAAPGAPAAAALGDDSDVLRPEDVAGLMFASLPAPTVAAAVGGGGGANRLEVADGTHARPSFLAGMHQYSGTLFAFVPEH